MTNNMTEDTFDELVMLYGNSILRMCYMYLKDYQLAEDVTQETFIKVYEKMDSFKNKSSIKTWITRIAINLCKNQIRTHWFKRVAVEHIQDMESKDEYEKIINRNSVSQEIMKLQPKYKEVILLFYYQELSVKEISYVLKIKETTVLQRMRRAREQLKTSLKEVL